MREALKRIISRCTTFVVTREDCNFTIKVSVYLFWIHAFDITYSEWEIFERLRKIAEEESEATNG
jgi:hypothetical protein